MLVKKCIFLGTDEALLSSVFSYLQGSVFGAPQQQIKETNQVNIMSVSGFVPNMIPNIIIANATFLNQNLTLGERLQVLLQEGLV